ncbi:MAG: dTDP-4-dehydrorhamnose reductase [Nitrospirae bacterium]|nr:dTDP-4-dehydrorhamnose reductase [Nitrospirota bacterium]
MAKGKNAITLKQIQNRKGKKKVLITGANGMLGGSLLGQLKKKYSIKGITKKEADITDLNAITKAIAKVKPDIVIHTAAYTKVDDCESNIKLAYKVNAIGARNVAIACRRIDAALVYISTDYVFDGTKDSPYIEFDAANPLSVYGKTKLAGEEFIKQILNRFYIIRTSWLYGAGGVNFVDTIIKKVNTVGAQGNVPLKVVDDQRGSPTYTNDLADKISEIIKEERYGIYHITNSDSCSWFEFAKKIIEYSNIKGVDVIPIKSNVLNRPAKRPSNSVLKNFMLELEGIPLLRSWDEAVREHIEKNG